MKKNKITDKDIKKALKRNKDDKISNVSIEFATKYLNFNSSRNTLEKNLKKNKVETKFIIDLLKECVDFHTFIKKSEKELRTENPKLTDKDFENILVMLEAHINWCNQNLNLLEQVKKVKDGFYEYKKSKKVKK